MFAYEPNPIYKLYIKQNGVGLNKNEENKLKQKKREHGNNTKHKNKLMGRT